MKILKIDKRKKVYCLITLLILLILFYVVLTIYNIRSVKKYDNLILPNTFIEHIDFSNYSFEDSKKIILFYQDSILEKKVILKVNNQDLEYTLKDFGVTIDQDKTLNMIKDYQKKLSYSKKLMAINGNASSNFTFSYQYSEDMFRNFLAGLKEKCDVNPVDGYFDTSEGVRYQAGVNGYSLKIDESLKVILDFFNKGFVEGEIINLDGDSIGANTNEAYTSIDTLTSQFVTTFMPNTYLRNINLNTALGYINGTVVLPGEVFSYCNKAGPFNKSGYVFYYEFVGNGVCQIATTTYNAALLGGLEIVKRYPHDKKSLYVDGGLDATVASYSSGWCVDMQFKNTYEYPIYIKAYSEGGRAHVEFWSNSQAKKGYEYTTSSKQIGARGYKSYLHTWKDGVEVDVHEIATTWYTKD